MGPSTGHGNAPDAQMLRRCVTFCSQTTPSVGRERGNTTFDDCHYLTSRSFFFASNTCQSAGGCGNVLLSVRRLPGPVFSLWVWDLDLDCCRKTMKTNRQPTMALHAAQQKSDPATHYKYTQTGVCLFAFVRNTCHPPTSHELTRLI